MVREPWPHHKRTGSGEAQRGTTVKAARPEDTTPRSFPQASAQIDAERPQLPKLRAQAPSSRAGRRNLLWSTALAVRDQVRARGIVPAIARRGTLHPLGKASRHPRSLPQARLLPDHHR